MKKIQCATVETKTTITSWTLAFFSIPERDLSSFLTVGSPSTRGRNLTNLKFARLQLQSQRMRLYLDGHESDLFSGLDSIQNCVAVN